jgi:hypothetical protein
MRCGAPATCWREKWFEFPEGARGFVGFGPIKQVMELIWLAQSFGRDGLLLKAPFCAQHRNHWRGRSVVIGGGILLLLTAFVGSIFTARPLGLDVGYVWLGLLGAFLIWAVAAVVAHETSIKPKSVAKDCLALRGVGDRFVDALEDGRRQGGRRW